jgi:hypothetical protein
MNRLIVKAAFLLLCCVGATAFAESDTPSSSEKISIPAGNLTIQGDMRVRIEDLGKTDFKSDRAETLLRVRPMLIWKPVEQATVVLQFQAAKAMGEPTYTPSSTTANTRQETSGATNGDSALTYHQAYGKYQPVEWFQIALGRQVLSYGNELIIGESDWVNVSRSFDVLKVRGSYGIGWTDLFASKLVDTNTTGAGAGDKDFYGMYNGWDFGPYLKQFDIYFLDLHDATVNPSTDMRVMGARAQSKIGQLDYRAEWTRETQVTSGYQVNAEVGYAFDLAQQPRLSAEYFYASEDFNQLFTTAHKWLGYADVVGRRNLSGYGAHLSSGILSWMSGQVDYYAFRRAKSDRSAYKVNGTTALGSGTASTSSDLGSEADFTLKFKPTAGVAFALGFSEFYSGAYLKDQLGSSNPTFYYGQMELKF